MREGDESNAYEVYIFSSPDDNDTTLLAKNVISHTVKAAAGHSGLPGVRARGEKSSMNSSDARGGRRENDRCSGDFSWKSERRGWIFVLCKEVGWRFFGGRVGGLVRRLMGFMELMLVDMSVYFFRIFV